MKASSWLVVALVATPCFGANQHYAGVAYDGKGQVAYREEHWLYETRGVPTRLVTLCAPIDAVAANRHSGRRRNL